MCGRATLTNSDINRIVADLDAQISPDDAALFRPRYNIAPSDLHWILTSHGDGRFIVPAVWGYLASGRPLINVRSEQVGSGAGFRNAFTSRRCLMITDGFFEWDKDRAPFWFHPTDGGLLLLAGLSQAAQPHGDSNRQQRFTVLTTRPNRMVAMVHNRMPVVIAADRVDEWLTAEPIVAARLLGPLSEDQLIATPVSRRVNTVRNDDPECLAPANLDPRPAVGRQGRLF